MRTPNRRERRTPVTPRAWVLRMLLALALALGMGAGGVVSPASAYDEGTIVALANDARAQNGLGGLVRNGSLDSVALNWANQMAANGTLSHNPNVGSQIPGGWRGWGENVAQGYGSGSAVHNGWMASSGHRANILGNFTDVGVALIQAGGTTWAVQVFANYPGSGLPAPAPPAPAPAPAAPAPAPAAPAPAPAPAAPAPAAPAPAAPAPADADATTDAESAPADAAAPTPSDAPDDAAAPAGSPGPTPKQAASATPEPGLEASSTAAVPSVGPWVAAGALVVLAVAVAVWPWIASRRRRHKADPGT